MTIDMGQWKPKTERKERNLWDISSQFSIFIDKFLASKVAYPWTRKAQEKLPPFEMTKPTLTESFPSGIIPQTDRPMQSYEQWQAPWGVKGGMEFALGAAATGGISGGGKRVVGEGAEQAAKQTPKVAKVVERVVAPLMDDLADSYKLAVDQIENPDLLRRIGNLPGIRGVARILTGKATTMKNPAEVALVGRAMQQAEAATKTQGVLAPLWRLGNSAEAFNLAADGTVAKGALKGIHLNDIRTYPNKYPLTFTQKLWVEQANEIEKAKSSFLARNGIKINELSFGEGGQYAGRRVFAKVTSDGELVDAAYVGAGVGRPGGKAAFEKIRTFKSAEEALKEGYRYLPEEEALYYNVRAAYNRVADKQMADWFMANVPWRTTGAPEELIVASSIAKQRAGKSQQTISYLQRVLRGEKLPESSIRSVEGAFPEFNIRAVLASKETIKEGLAQAKKMSLRFQGEYALAKQAQSMAKARLGKAGFEEAAIAAPAFAGKIFTGPQAREAAKIFSEELRPQYIKALGELNKANAVARLFALAGDASPFTIQLMFLAGAHPTIYAKSMGGFVKAFFDPQFLAKYYTNHATTIAKSPSLLLSRGGATEFTEAMAKGGFMRAKPLKWMGKALEPFQRGFETALDVAGIEMREAYEHLATNPKSAEQVEQFINEFRGLFNSSRVGISLGQRQLETAALLAPRYNRAVVALLSDIFRGNLRGSLARKAMAKGVTAVLAMGTAVSMALGEDMDEMVEHLNPTSPEFLTWNIMGQSIGPGGKVRSLIRLMGQVAKEPESLLEPQEGGYIWKNPFLRFVRSNLAPAASTGLDLLMGQDFVGEPTRDGLLSLSERVLGRNMLPIWIQSVIIEGGDLGQRAFRAAGEFMGLRTFPEQPKGKGGRVTRKSPVPTRK